MTWVLITGATARGGEAIGRLLHEAGLGIIAHHSPRSRATASALADELNARRAASVRLWEADLSQPVTVPAWLVALEPQHCVCNASVYQPSQLDDESRRQDDLAVHVFAHASILAALRGRLSSVVAVTDIHVSQPARSHVWYTVAKAGLQALMLTLAVEWAPEIRCNVVAPGALPFPPTWAEQEHEREQAILDSIPLQRLGRFDELASAVKWLLIDATYVTGQVLPLDGGRSRCLV